jgi:hypothetical protein
MVRVIAVMAGLATALPGFALCIANPAGAQENLDKGKTAAQLYANDCAICHKSPQSITQAPGVFGLESFLREHYTASRESAASIAAYLKKLEKPSAGRRPGQAAMRTSQRKSSEPVLRESDERGLRPPANIPRPPANIRP